MVVAGLLLGNRGPHDAMSDQTQRYLFGFWKVVDEILNSVLFLLIGLEVVVLRFDPGFAWLMALSVPLVLTARFIAVSILMLALQHWQSFSRGTLPVMIWGGLRGGISVCTGPVGPGDGQQGSAPGHCLHGGVVHHCRPRALSPPSFEKSQRRRAPLQRISIGLGELVGFRVAGIRN